MAAGLTLVESVEKLLEFRKAALVSHGLADANRCVQAHRAGSKLFEGQVLRAIGVHLRELLADALERDYKILCERELVLAYPLAPLALRDTPIAIGIEGVEDGFEGVAPTIR